VTTGQGYLGLSADPGLHTYSHRSNDR
ncbi:MAG: hypothetical protein QOE54_2160, partial [Streptosporangiaceae bacterium]|nr:hypothetical protein [Streptosporangiaceae bacterium]